VFAGLKERFFGNGKHSKSMAKSRLHFVLVQDRSGLTNDDMAAFKQELVEVISRYFVIDESGFDVNYKRDSDTSTLLINSPVVVRRQDAPDKAVGARARGARK
jgi:cell division topological specificity factor